jgi:hypothetical protein
MKANKSARSRDAERRATEAEQQMEFKFPTDHANSECVLVAKFNRSPDRVVSSAIQRGK